MPVRPKLAAAPSWPGPKNPPRMVCLIGWFGASGLATSNPVLKLPFVTATSSKLTFGADGELQLLKVCVDCPVSQIKRES